MLLTLVCFPDNKTEIIAGVSCGLGFLAILLVTNLVRYYWVFVISKIQLVVYYQCCILIG